MHKSEDDTAWHGHTAQGKDTGLNRRVGCLWSSRGAGDSSNATLLLKPAPSFLEVDSSFNLRDPAGGSRLEKNSSGPQRTLSQGGVEELEQFGSVFIALKDTTLAWAREDKSRRHSVTHLFVFFRFLHFHLDLFPWNHAVLPLFPVLQILRRKKLHDLKKWPTEMCVLCSHWHGYLRYLYRSWVVFSPFGFLAFFTFVPLFLLSFLQAGAFLMTLLAKSPVSVELWRCCD